METERIKPPKIIVEAAVIRGAKRTIWRALKRGPVGLYEYFNWDHCIKEAERGGNEGVIRFYSKWGGRVVPD